MRDIRRQTTSDDSLEVKRVPLSLIVESDALRLRFPPYPGIDELVESIRQQSQTTPMFVQPMNTGNLELIAGYSRFEALKRLNAEHAIVRVFRHLSPQEAYDLAISENQKRNDMSEYERATICLNLQKSGRTTRQIAETMKWSAESSVFRYLRLAKESPASLREALQKRQISMSVATTFLDEAQALPEQLQREALTAAAEHEMSAAEFKRYLRRAAGAEDTPSKPKAPIRKLKDGGFVITARVEATDSTSIDQAISVLENALKDARRLKRNLGKNEAASQEPIQ